MAVTHDTSQEEIQAVEAAGGFKSSIFTTFHRVWLHTENRELCVYIVILVQVIVVV